MKPVGPSALATRSARPTDLPSRLESGCTLHDRPACSAEPAEADLLLHAPANGQPITLGHQLAIRMYEHQITGIKWLASLYGKGRGGILGDDMGLGKVGVFLGPAW